MKYERGRRRLMDDISLHEMLQMRDTGMTNQAIADALGVSRATIYRHIGGVNTRKRSTTAGDAPRRMTQTEKFMSRINKRDMQVGAPPACAYERPCEPDDDTTSEEKHAQCDPEAAVRPETDMDTKSMLPRPVRVTKEYAVGDTRIVWDNGKITITGAEDMDGAAVRMLCRTLMLIKDWEE